MANRNFWPKVKSNVAKVCVSIKAAKVGLAQIHKNFVSAFDIATVLAVVGLYNGVGKWIVWIRSRQYLLHLKFRTRPPRDDWSGPFFNRLAFLAPVVLGGIPHAPFFHFERGKSKRLHIEPSRFNFTREVGTARVAPLFAWLDDDDLTGNNLPKAAGTKCYSVVTSTQAAACGGFASPKARSAQVA